ncbi:sialidase family protein [Arenimonas fontis]|nr:sialidase family protein [Arenimonas fontis]
MAWATATPSVHDWPLPAPAGSAQPSLVVAADGDLLLAWVERREGGGHRMRFARHEAGTGWSPTRTVAEGADWFVNWADVPSLLALPDGSLWAHLLVKNGEATYAYDTRLLRSRDAGMSWTALGPVHDDGTPTEHGFASLWPQGHDRLGVAWLDGRHTGGGGHGHHGGAGAMSLRAAVLGPDGRKATEAQIDARTCDCCQTDVAVTARGPLLVYRDRSEGEVRDILATRFDGSAWSASVPVHADGWVMPACPVNGPAVAALGEQAWVAWYTAAEGRVALRLAASRDAGDSFTAPREVVLGEHLLGRVDLAADASGVWLAWMEEGADGQSLWLARFAHDLAKEHWRLRVAAVPGRGRGTGFPRLRLAAGEAWLAWTAVEGGLPSLRGARVRSP